MSDLVTEIVGDEYDEKVWASLKSAIQELNGKVIDEQSALAGSQELNRFEVDIEGDKVEIESETYIGVSISGSFELIKRIREMMKSTR